MRPSFIMTAAVFEILIFGGILGFFGAMLPDLKGLSLRISLVEKPLAATGSHWPSPNA
jgi:hypothetical protein